MDRPRGDPGEERRGRRLAAPARPEARERQRRGGPAAGPHERHASASPTTASASSRSCSTSTGSTWEYEPRTFDLEWDRDGNAVQAFTPDFYLPAYDLYIEITTLNQKLVTKKNRKARRLRELYPGVNCKVFYQRDYLSLLVEVRARGRLRASRPEPPPASRLDCRSGMRFAPHTDDDVREMLEAIGLGSLDELFEQIPAGGAARPAARAPRRASPRWRSSRTSRRSRRGTATPTTSCASPAAGAYDHYVPGGRLGAGRAGRSSTPPTRRTSRSCRRASSRRCSSTSR